MKIYFAFTVLLAVFPLAAQEVLQPCDSLYADRQFKESLRCVLDRMDSGYCKTVADSLKGFQMTAVLYYLLEDFEKTNLYFDQMLFMDQDVKLDPADVPPEILALFNNRKSALFGREPGDDPLNLLPFGIGHFRMKKYHRAVLYSFIAAVSLGVNVRAYQARESMKNDDGTYGNPDKALTFYRVQLTAFYAGFLGAGLASFIDAWRSR